MAPQWTTNRQYCLPSSAVGVTVTPSGVSWTSGAYKVIGTPGSNGVLTGISFRTAYLDAAYFEIDIASGTPGSESVISTIKGYTTTVLGVNDNGMYITIPLPVDLISSGIPLSARIRLSTNSVIVWLISITYLAKPIAGALAVTTNPIKAAPPAADSITITDGGSAWTSGAWVTIIASPSVAIILVGITFYVASGHVYTYEFDIGVGASPTVVTTISSVAGGTGIPFILMLKNPLDAFPATTAIKARWRNSENFPYNNAEARIGLMYIDK